MDLWLRYAVLRFLSLQSVVVRIQSTSFFPIIKPESVDAILSSLFTEFLSRQILSRFTAMIILPVAPSVPASMFFTDFSHHS